MDGQTDPWAVVSQAPASNPPSTRPSGGNDPWAVVSQAPTAAGGGDSSTPTSAPYKPSLPAKLLAMTGFAGGDPGVAEGMLRGGAETVSGLGKLAEKIPGVSMIPGEERRQKFLDRMSDYAEGGTTPQEAVGKLVENIGEFAIGGEALKGLSYAEKMTKILPFLKTIEGDSVLMNALKKGIMAGSEQGLIGGVQTAAKTGSVGAGVAGGVLSGVTGGLVEGAAAGAPPIIRNIQGGGAAKIAQAAKNEATQAGLSQAAQDIVERHVGEANTARMEAGQGFWTQLDPEKYMGNVTSFPEAVDQVKGIGKEIYGKLDEESGGRFSTLRDEQRAAQDALDESNTKENVARAAKADAAMKQFFDGTKGVVEPADHQIAQASYYKELRLNRISNVVENAMNDDGSINGTSMLKGLRGLQQDWGTGTQGRKEMEDIVGPNVLQNMEDIARANLTPAGRENTSEAIKNVILRTLAKAGAGETVLHSFFGAPIGMTTLGGTTLYLAGKKFVQLMETNPKIGNAMVWAVEHRVPPATYVPIVTNLVTSAVNQSNATTESPSQ